MTYIKMAFTFSAQEFDELYIHEETYDPKHYMYEFVAAKCYDHVWVAALALNCTETYLANIGKLPSIMQVKVSK